MQCYRQSQIEQIDDSAYLSENVTHSSHIIPQTRPYSCPAKAISDPLVPYSPTLLCPAELSVSPLSFRWKAKGNGSPTGNIRTGKQPLHLLASRSLRTPVPRGPGSAQDLGWEDQGMDWFYPAWQRIQAPAPSLNHRFVCCNRLLWTSALNVLFSCQLYFHAYVTSFTSMSYDIALWYYPSNGLTFSDLFLSPSPLLLTLCPLSEPILRHFSLNHRSILHLASLVSAGQQQAAVGLGPIQCNPANTGVGWPYPAQAAVHFRNVLFLPGRTAAAHLYGLIGFGEKLSACLWHSGTNSLAN